MDGDEVKVLIEELQRDVEAGQDGALRESLRRLLNLVERVVAENAQLQAENDLLRKQRKLPGPPAADASSKSVAHDVSSEKERRQRERKPTQKPDRRTFADISVQEDRDDLVAGTVNRLLQRGHLRPVRGGQVPGRELGQRLRLGSALFQAGKLTFSGQDRPSTANGSAGRRWRRP